MILGTTVEINRHQNVLQSIETVEESEYNQAVAIKAAPPVHELHETETVENARHVLQLRLHSFLKHYEQINTQLESYCVRLESYSLNGLYQDKRSNQPYSATIQTYRMKLQSIRVFILRINDKLSRLQSRLNTIRSRLPKGHVYVETGPFPYRCVYKGGVRYRSFPSSSASLLRDKPPVELGEEVRIAQRVFVTAEESIFLHHFGVGWLLENKGHIRCFERVVEPSREEDVLAESPNPNPNANNANLPSLEIKKIS